MLTISSRLISNFRATEGRNSTESLPRVAARLSLIQGAQDPQDYHVYLPEVEVLFNNGTMFMDLPQAAQRFRLSTLAASQWASNILPRGYWTGTKQLARLPGGGPIATAAWQKFAERKARGNDRCERVIRTVRMRINGQAYRVVRAVVSTTYTRYAHTDFVKALSESSRFDELPVLFWALTDTSLRLQFMCTDLNEQLFSAYDESFASTNPVPIVTASNSEVGAGSIRLKGGLYLQVPGTQGCYVGHWGKGWARQHRGDLAKVSGQVRDQWGLLQGMAEETRRAYRAATSEMVEAPFQKLLEVLGEATEATQALAAEELKKRVDAAELAGQERQVTIADIVDSLAVAAETEDLSDTEAGVLHEASSGLLESVFDAFTAEPAQPELNTPPPPAPPAEDNSTDFRSIIGGF